MRYRAWILSIALLKSGPGVTMGKAIDSMHIHKRLTAFFFWLKSCQKKEKNLHMCLILRRSYAVSQ